MADLAHDSYSVQATAARGEGHSLIEPNETGKVIRLFFSYTVPTGGEADDNQVELRQLPAGAILLGGSFNHDGLGNAVDIGLYGSNADGTYDGTNSDDDDFLLAAGSTASAGAVVFGNTLARNYGYELTKDCDLVATVETGAWTAGKVIKGHVDILTGQ